MHKMAEVDAADATSAAQLGSSDAWIISRLSFRLVLNLHAGFHPPTVLPAFIHFLQQATVEMEAAWKSVFPNDVVDAAKRIHGLLKRVGGEASAAKEYEV